MLRTEHITYVSWRCVWPEHALLSWSLAPSLPHTPLPPSLPPLILLPPFLSEPLHHVGYKELREAKEPECVTSMGAKATLRSDTAALLINLLGNTEAAGHRGRRSALVLD